MPAPSRPIVVVPLKPVTAAKRRLAATIDQARLADLVLTTAQHVIDAGQGCGAEVIVIAGDATIAAWAHQAGVLAVPDPGGGLNGAAAAGAALAAMDGRSWAIVHGDLPLLTSTDLQQVFAAVGSDAAVLAPSRDGGTSILASVQPLQFAYGPDSFSRHLRATAHLRRTVITRVGTLVDLDTAADLEGAAALPGGRWLVPHLG